MAAWLKKTYLRKIMKTLNEIGNFKCFRNTSAIGFSMMKNKECIFGIELHIDNVKLNYG